MTDKDLMQLQKKHDRILRSPEEIFGSSFICAGITTSLLKVKVSDSFVELLETLGITLIITREYENLIIALTSFKNSLIQSFFHVPHPSGLVYDIINNSLYVALTRNPNQIMEFKPGNKNHPGYNEMSSALIPVRGKYYGGAHYFHDLGMISGKLFANSVGKNGIMNIDFSKSISEDICWWPKCVEMPDGLPATSKNFIQLNSIASGDTIENSFFSASSDKMSFRRPGHLNFNADKKGVIFSGKSREPITRGLTRPHSARLNNDLLWINNSGYGEVGYVTKGMFNPVQKFNGWTRGLCFRDRFMFVGISRILPRFRQYAPGIKTKDQSCSVMVIDNHKNEVVATIQWPNGNQIFGIEIIPRVITGGFPFISARDGNPKIKEIFSSLNY